MSAIVLCIGGRGPLDEAAALLLVSLLEKADVNARVATAPRPRTRTR